MLHGRATMVAIAVLASAGTVALTAVAAFPAAALSPSTHVYWAGEINRGKAERPAALFAELGGHRNAVVAVDWTDWGDTTAVGTGVLRISGTDDAQTPVQVSLGGRVDCFGTQVYTSWTLTLPADVPSPPFFNKASHVSAPCFLGPCPAPRAHCTIKNDLTFRKYVEYPLGSKGWLYSVTWVGGDKATATATGILLRNRRYGAARSTLAHWFYPVRLRMSWPRLCGDTIARAQLRITSYGEGVQGPGLVGPPTAMLRRRLLSALASSPSPRHTAVYARSGCTSNDPS